MRFIKWVVKPEILLRRRFDGTVACFSGVRSMLTLLKHETYVLVEY
jgi:hypothetical protein